MALRVWLPLNGNINNYGISDAVVTNSGATVDNNGKIGKCYAFNGTNNYMTVPLKYSDTMTFALWYKPSINSNSFSSFHHIFDGRVNESGQEVLCLESPSFKAWGFHVSINLPQNVWTHICAINNKGVVQIYVNGILAGTGTTTMNSSYSGDLYIGARHSKQNFLAESMNDIRIYDHCLSPKEVKEISKGLCLHYKLDGVCNTVDSTEWDCSGFGNNGTKIGTITCDSDTPRYTTSYKMVSSNVGTSTSSGMTIIYSNGGLTTPSAMTIAFWLKPIRWNYQDSGLLSTTMESYPTDYLTSAINQYDGVFRFNTSDGSTLTISATSLVNDSLWHHYSFVFDGINVKVYKDGTLTNLGKSFSSTKTLGSFNKIFIGLSQAGGAWRQTSAYWSDFRLYATALSDADIKELYNTSASIDNLGNVYGYEFVEETE